MKAKWNIAAIVVFLVTTACYTTFAAKSGAKEREQPKVKRFAAVIGLKPEKMAEYKKLHAHAWPGVLKMIKQCHIQNYSIYLAETKKGEYQLFSYFEYTGKDFNADMKRMSADATCRKWWKYTDPCQIPLATRKKGELWKGMEEVFHNQ